MAQKFLLMILLSFSYGVQAELNCAELLSSENEKESIQYLPEHAALKIGYRYAASVFQSKDARFVSLTHMDSKDQNEAIYNLTFRSESKKWTIHFSVTVNTETRQALELGDEASGQSYKVINSVTLVPKS